MERAWRYVPKPLLRLGGKGVTLQHGNSLRQLLEQHQIVKVKVNDLRPFQTSNDDNENHNNPLSEAFEQLKQSANTAPQQHVDMELLQYRNYDKIILIGLPGMRTQIQNGTFPPQL